MTLSVIPSVCKDISETGYIMLFWEMLTINVASTVSVYAAPNLVHKSFTVPFHAPHAPYQDTDRKDILSCRDGEEGQVPRPNLGDFRDISLGVLGFPSIPIRRIGIAMLPRYRIQDKSQPKIYVRGQSSSDKSKQNRQGSLQRIHSLIKQY